MNFDFQAVQRQHAQGARRAFTRLRAEHGTESFYAFALYTSDDATGVDIGPLLGGALQAALRPPAGRGPQLPALVHR
jgi:hypothetical protein